MGREKSELLECLVAAGAGSELSGRVDINVNRIVHSKNKRTGIF
jgi:hypothetical protein